MKRSIDLNGVWQFAPDLQITPSSNHNLTDGDTPANAYANMNRRHWQQVNVPDVWQRYGEKYSIFEGNCWFCKEVELDGITDTTKARICFEGVSYKATVYVNEVLVGVHESAYTAFSMDVSGLLKNGKNFIAVEVDNRVLMMKWPNDRGYFFYGGIHRDVRLELMEGNYLDHVTLTPLYDVQTSEGIAAIKGFAYGATKVQIRCAGKIDEVLVSKDGSFCAELRYAGITPWSPEAPKLYTLEVADDFGQVETYETGFRCLTVENGKLYLNGNPYYLKGCAHVHDTPLHGFAMTQEELELDINLMKEGGMNAVRTHWPMDEKFYRLCDQKGLLVWIEPPVYCSKPANDQTNTVFARPEYVALAKQIVTEMIANARSHPSVSIYSVGNECNVEHPEAKPFFRELVAHTRATDSSRVISYAALYDLIGEMGELVDILGINSYYGWYDKVCDVYEQPELAQKDGMVVPEPVDLTAFHEMMKKIEAVVPQRVPLLLTEFGADSIPGFFASGDDMWSENYHAKVLRNMFTAAHQHPRIFGTFMFCFTDYADPSKPFNGFWNGYNLKGMVTYNRQKKLPFYAMQEEYTR